AARPELNGAEGRAAHEQSAVPAELRDRLKELQDTLADDQNDFRFVARIEEIRLDQTALDDKVENFRMAESIPQIKDAFKAHYGVDFGASEAEQVTNLILSRPEPIRQHLAAALDFCVSYAPKSATEDY